MLKPCCSLTSTVRLVLNLRTSPEAERVDAVQSEDSSDVVEPPAFEGIGSTLTDPKLVARFEGVRRDLAREIRSEMCTVEQALRYLEHLEITLLMEQDGDL